MSAPHVTGNAGRITITVDYLADDCMCHDDWTTDAGDAVNAKIHADGRGYVKTSGMAALYAKAQRIVIHAAGGEPDL